MATHARKTNVKNGMDREQLRKKLPIEFDRFYTVLQKCAGLLIDTSLPSVCTDLCYAVLSVEYTVFAYTFFLIAVCPRYRTAAVRIVEEQEHITLDVELVPRAGITPCDPFAEDKTAYALFLRNATQTDIALTFVPTAEGLIARFSFVRFRADKVAAGGVDEGTVSDLMMEAMKEYAEKRDAKK